MLVQSLLKLRGENYGAAVYTTAFAAFTALGAGFAAGTDHFNAKVYGSPLGNLEVKLIGSGTDSVATIDLATYAGRLFDVGIGDSVSIPFTDFSNPDTDWQTYSGYLNWTSLGIRRMHRVFLDFGHDGVEYGC